MAGRSNGGDLGVEEEILRDGGGGFRCGGGGGRVVAREVVDGGAYGVQLAEEVVRDRVRGRRFGRLDGRGEVIKGEDVGCHHGQEKKEVQAHGETH